METTLIAINEKYKRYIEEHPKYFLDALKEGFCLSVQEQKKREKGMLVFPQISDRESSLYLLRKGEVIGMSPDSAETLRLIRENPEYVKAAIGFMKNETSRLEGMLAESENKKD